MKHNYQTSTDYELLWEIIKTQPVIYFYNSYVFPRSAMGINYLHLVDGVVFYGDTKMAFGQTKESLKRYLTTEKRQ